MLRSLTSAQESFDATAAELELSYPVTSLDKWATAYEPVLTGFWHSTATSLSRVALRQYQRWCAQNVQYAELFISRILGALDGEPLREWFRALARDLQHAPGRCVVKPVVCLSRDKVTRHQQKILEPCIRRPHCWCRAGGQRIRMPHS